MKISAISKYSTVSNKTSFQARNNNPISDNDIDSFSLSTQNQKQNIIRSLSPQWEVLRIKGNLMYAKRNKIRTLGKALMQEGYTMEKRFPSMQKEAAEIAEQSKEKFKDALNLIQEAKANNYRTIYNKDSSQYWSRRDIQREPDEIIITEYDDDDTSEVLRKIRLQPEKIIVEDVRYFSGYVDEYVFDRESGTLISLTKGKNETLSGGYKAEESYSYHYTGELQEYKQNIKVTKNHDESASKYYTFDKNAITKYFESYFVGGEECHITAEKVLSFTNGELTQADIKFKDIIDGEKTSSKQFLFDTRGNIDAYVTHLKETPNGIITAQDVYNYKDGIIEQMLSDYEAFVHNKIVSAKNLFKINWNQFFVESCETNNKGLLGDKYRIEDCHSEKLARFFKY